MADPAHDHSITDHATGATHKPQHKGREYVLGGAAPVVHYLMRGRRVSDNVWISWGVTATPDTAGALAPSSVVSGTIDTVHRWTT